MVALLAVALTLRLAACDRWTHDLQPSPDALEYTMVARSLVSGQGLCLVIDGHQMPSRYPPGTALCLALALLWPGVEVGQAFLAILALGLLTVVLLYRLLDREVATAAALVATLFLVFSPTHVHFSVLAMSEVPSALAVLGVLVLGWPLLEAAPARGSRRAFLVGFLAGLSTLLRYPNLLIGACFALVLLLKIERRRQGVAVAFGMALGCLPVLLFNQAMFGAFGHSGYRFWEPNDYLLLEDCVSLRFLFEPVNPAWEGGNLAYYARILTGLDRSVYSPVVALLGLGGVAVLVRRRAWPRVGVLGLFVLGTAAFYSCYFFRAARLLIVTLPMVCVLAGLGLEALSRVVCRRLARAEAGFCAAVAVLALVLSFGWDGLRDQARDTLGFIYQHPFGDRHEAFGPELPEVLAALPADALLLLDLARLHLEPHLRAGQKIMAVSAASGATVHTALSWRHELIDRDGRPARFPALFDPQHEFVAAAREQLDAHYQSGGKVFLLYAPRSTILKPGRGPEFQRFLDDYQIKPMTSRPGLQVLEVVPRPR